MIVLGWSEQLTRRVMGHDDDRVEFIANAILRAVGELTETKCEITIEATLARLDAYRRETNDDFMSDIYRDAIRILRYGRA